VTSRHSYGPVIASPRAYPCSASAARAELLRRPRVARGRSHRRARHDHRTHRASGAGKTTLFHVSRAWCRPSGARSGSTARHYRWARRPGSAGAGSSALSGGFQNHHPPKRRSQGMKTITRQGYANAKTTQLQIYTSGRHPAQSAVLEGPPFRHRAVSVSDGPTRRCGWNVRKARGRVPQVSAPARVQICHSFGSGRFRGKSGRLILRAYNAGHICPGRRRRPVCHGPAGPGTRRRRPRGRHHARDTMEEGGLAGAAGPDESGGS